jgi:hypothetical protein
VHVQETPVENTKKEAPKPKLSLKLSLKKETLRTLEAPEVSALDEVVGGTCPCTWMNAKTYA